MEQMIRESSAIAIISGDRHIGFLDMRRRVSQMAAQCNYGKGERTLIVAENRAGWIYSLYAVWTNEGIVVPVDASSTANDIAYIIDDCQPSGVWTTKQKEALVKAAIAESTFKPQILLIDDYEEAELHDEVPAQVPCRYDDTALICYTSGTTGSPKGVMLSFENIMANVRAISTEVHIFDESLRTLILLPLHHVLPLVGSIVMPMQVGGGVAICPSLAAPDIMRTLKDGKIGIMIGVPRLWQTLYRGIKAKIDQKAITRALYNLCAKVQSRTLSRIIFSSVRKKMGGAITWCVSGGAALDRETALGLKTLGLDMLEGYGMTEAAPMITFTRPGDIRPGCVGLPMPSVEVKLIDGELCARGRNIMQGYYKRPEETAEVIDKDGFLHTGDLGTIDECGRVTITGRKKEIIVLSNGKNITPTEIEEKIGAFAQIVKEVAVVQDGDMLKAIIVPHDEWVGNMTHQEVEDALKRDVLQPYNQSVAPYKKVMSVFVYRGELPRTRLDKLQRFKLMELLSQGEKPQPKETTVAESSAVCPEEYAVIKKYIVDEKHCTVKPTDNIETDLAFDSLDKVALQGFLEQTFGIKLSVERISSFADINEMAKYINERKTRVQVNNIDWKELLSMPSSSQELPRMAYSGNIIVRVFYYLSVLMFRLKVKGQENIPANGPYILAPNHQSFLDAPLVMSKVSWKVMRHTYFYAKKDHIRSGIARFFARNHNIVIMDMSTLKDSILALSMVLKQGRNIVIFPEGTRCRKGKVGQFKKTFAILSSELNVPVVPVCIKGAYDALPRGKWFPRFTKIEVEYLPPVFPQEQQSYEDLANEVREKIVQSLSEWD